MIDVHCHILPGIDDGPSDFEGSLDMCRMAALDGITRIIATPHFNTPIYDSSSAMVGALVAELNSLLSGEGIPLVVQSGAEAHARPDLAALIKNGGVPTLDPLGRYALVEFPFEAMPPNWEAFLRQFAEVSGCTPVLAHPERNAWFMNRPSALVEAVGDGLALVQITAMSVTGEHGPAIREFSDFLITRGCVHAIATDAHSCDYRPPVLSGARKAAVALIGEEQAGRLFTENPDAIAKGLSLEAAGSRPPGAAKKWLQRLIS